MQTNDTKKISIIVPVYNAEQYLSKCIESLTSQTYQDIQIILVDDGSTDLSPEICDSYAEGDDRIIVIHKKNCGVSAARNTGLKTATGSWIGFVDADDWVSSDMYQKLLDNALRENADISAGGIVDVYGDQWKPRRPQSKEDRYLCGGTEQAWVYSNTDTHMSRGIWNKIYRKKIIKDIHFLDGFYVEDMAFHYEALTNCKLFVFDATPLYYYRHLKESRSENPVNVDIETPFYFLDKYITTRTQYSKAAPYMMYVMLLEFVRVYELSLRSVGKKQYKKFRKQARHIIRSNYRYVSNSTSPRILAVARSHKMKWFLVSYMPLLFQLAYYVYRRMLSFSWVSLRVRGV